MYILVRSGFASSDLKCEIFAINRNQLQTFILLYVWAQGCSEYASVPVLQLPMCPHAGLSAPRHNRAKQATSSPVVCVPCMLKRRTYPCN